MQFYTLNLHRYTLILRRILNDTNRDFVIQYYKENIREKLNEICEERNRRNYKTRGARI